MPKPGLLKVGYFRHFIYRDYPILEFTFSEHLSIYEMGSIPKHEVLGETFQSGGYKVGIHLKASQFLTKTNNYAGRVSFTRWLKFIKT